MKPRISLWLMAAIFLATVSNAHAQQPSKVPHIGYLVLNTLSSQVARMEAFRQGLRELGYVEGKNVVIDWRSADGKLDAAELVRLKVGYYRHDWSDSNPSCQGSYFYDFHCL